ncbi:Cyclophilin type peptidyl-prolyl cis-trans isomerase/CLD [compost metagenome]
MAEMRRHALLALMAAGAATAFPALPGSAQVPEEAINPLLGYPRLVVPGPVLRFETTEGGFRIVLFSQDAPRLTRAFRERVEEGAFRKEGFWLARAEGVQLGRPDTDVSEAGGTIRSGGPGGRAMRDPNAIPFLATLGAFGFENTGLSPIPGSVMIDQRFIIDGQAFRREYFIALSPGFRRGVVVGHVISGLDVVRRFDTRDAILSVRVE